jgi:hypothetical protein
MRHLAQGIMLTLSGDWSYSIVKECSGDYAFSQTFCRTAILRSDFCALASDPTQKVKVIYKHHNPLLRATPPNVIQSGGGSGKTLHLYGVGNHPATGKHSKRLRLGMLNVPDYKKVPVDAL